MSDPTNPDLWQRTEGYLLHQMACDSSHIDQCSYYVGAHQPTTWAKATRVHWENRVSDFLTEISGVRGIGKHEEDE